MPDGSSQSDLLIQINADASNAKTAFDNLQSQSEDLRGALETGAIAAGVAFAAFTAEIYESVQAFQEHQESALSLNDALQNQGIYTTQLADQYRQYAEVVQQATGVDADQITKAQAVAQQFLGNIPITQEFTNAIANLGAQMGGDFVGAAQKMGEAIGTQRNAFRAQGLQISTTATEAEKYAQVLDFVQGKTGDFAAQMNIADGYSKSLASSFHDFQVAIGADFAPVISAARQALSAFFEALANNPLLTDLIASLIAAGAVVAGLGVAIGAAVPIFLTLSAAAAALGVSMSIAFLGIPLAIGAVVAAVTYLALNWQKSMAYLQSTATAVVTFLSELFSGFGKVLDGAFTFDPTTIQKGLDQLKASYATAKDAAVASFQAVTASQVVEGQKQDENRAAQAKARQAAQAQSEDILKQQRQANIDLINLQNANGSAQLIALKTQEVATLKALANKNSVDDVAELQTKLAQIRALELQAQNEEISRINNFGAIRQTVNTTLQQRGIQVDAQLTAAQLAALQAKVKTEEDIDRDLQTTLIAQETARENQLLSDRKQYGDQVAVLNNTLSSTEVQGAKGAADQLVGLEKSKNATLASIGKAAAVTQILISTAEGAAKAFEALYPIPFVGPPLAYAAEAAVIAFGAERIADVTSAADGGLITGGIPGLDSVPALLQPGELVVPEKNFQQVVGAVQGQGQSADGPQTVGLLQQIASGLNNIQPSIQVSGDVLGDNTYIDALIRKISDGIQFRNGKFVGINA